MLDLFDKKASVTKDPVAVHQVKAEPLFSVVVEKVVFEKDGFVIAQMSFIAYSQNIAFQSILITIKLSKNIQLKAILVIVQKKVKR